MEARPECDHPKLRLPSSPFPPAASTEEPTPPQQGEPSQKCRLMPGHVRRCWAGAGCLVAEGLLLHPLAGA